MWIIYKVQFPNGKVYIGQTGKSLDERRIDHWRDAQYELKKNIDNKFHVALRKHGISIEEDSLIWSEIDRAETLEEALQKEAFHISQHNSIHNGYNCRTSQNGKGFMDDATKCKIAAACGPLSKKMWEDPNRRALASAYMKDKHASGQMDEAKRKIAEVRRSEEQRKATSEDSKKRYQDQKKRDEMAINHGTKPFLVYRGDELIGRFVNIREAYRQLNIPNNGHITTILKKGKGTLYGYTFIYE